MKAFRGTLIAAALLLLVALAAWLLDPQAVACLFRDCDEVEEEGPPPFCPFEKQDLVRVVIERVPGDTLVLAEQADGEWLVEGPQWSANRSMVNRVKHQIHDLTARATLVGEDEAPELYGLGKNATRVALTLRDGRKCEFLAGDPNPSAVSYYFQPLPGEVVYTVKKSAVDYYTQKPEDFREPKFASLDSNDADRLEADLPGGRRLVLQRLNAYEWKLEEPVNYRASREEVRRLLGRVTALKARDYVEDHPTDLSKYGLDAPRARILVKFGSRAPIDVLIGASAAPDEGPGTPRTYAYMMLADGFTVYTASDDLLEDFLREPSEMRERKVMRMRVGDVTDALVNLMVPGDPDLSGQVKLLYRADKWLWEDGSPVPGSTPSRVVQRGAEIEADVIVADEAGNPSRWGFQAPILALQLTDRSGLVRTLIVGDETDPVTDPEGRVTKRYFARADDDPVVYVVDAGIIEVAEDAIRESRRKSGRDADKEKRLERIEEALGPQSTGTRDGEGPPPSAGPGSRPKNEE